MNSFRSWTAIVVFIQVESLVGRVERVGSMPLHPNVGVAIDRWLACIRELQTLRKDELSTLLCQHGSQHYGSKSYIEKGLAMLGASVSSCMVHAEVGLGLGCIDCSCGMWMFLFVAFRLRVVLLPSSCACCWFGCVLCVFVFYAGLCVLPCFCVHVT